MKTVLLLGGPAAGQIHEVHGAVRTILSGGTVGQIYHVVPMCSHGEVHWFGVQDGADPLALLIAGYAPAPVDALAQFVEDRMRNGIDAVVSANALTGGTPAPADYGVCECSRPGKFS